MSNKKIKAQDILDQEKASKDEIQEAMENIGFQEQEEKPLTKEAYQEYKEEKKLKGVDNIIVFITPEEYIEYDPSLVSTQADDLTTQISNSASITISLNNTSEDLIEDWKNDTITARNKELIKQVNLQLTKHFINNGFESYNGSISLTMGNKSMSQSKSNDNSLPEVIYELLEQTGYYQTTTTLDPFDSQEGDSGGVGFDTIGTRVKSVKAGANPNGTGDQYSVDDNLVLTNDKIKEITIGEVSSSTTNDDSTTFPGEGINQWRADIDTNTANITTNTNQNLIQDQEIANNANDIIDETNRNDQQDIDIAANQSEIANVKSSIDTAMIIRQRKDTPQLIEEGVGFVYLTNWTADPSFDLDKFNQFDKPLGVLSVVVENEERTLQTQYEVNIEPVGGNQDVGGQITIRNKADDTILREITFAITDGQPQTYTLTFNENVPTGATGFEVGYAVEVFTGGGNRNVNATVSKLSVLQFGGTGSANPNSSDVFDDSQGNPNDGINVKLNQVNTNRDRLEERNNAFNDDGKTDSLSMFGFTDGTNLILKVNNNQGSTEDYIFYSTSLNMFGKRIRGLPDPIDADEPANKQYVDSQTGGDDETMLFFDPSNQNTTIMLQETFRNFKYLKVIHNDGGVLRYNSFSTNRNSNEYRR